MESCELVAKTKVKPSSAIGAVLCGGASSRFGSDKAIYEHEGTPLAKIALNALREAGAAEVLSVGGDAAALAGMGFKAVPDDYPGEGPLGGLICAMRHATELAANRLAANPSDNTSDTAADGICLVLSCDLPRASAVTVKEVAEALASRPKTDAVLPAGKGDIPQYLHGAWRLRCRSKLEAAFAQGGRSIRDGLGMLAKDSVHLCHVSDM